MKYVRVWPVVAPSFGMVVVIGFVVCCESVTAQDRNQLEEIWRKKVPDETKRFSDWWKSRITGYRTSATCRIPVNDNQLTLHIQQVMKRKGAFYLFCSEESEGNPTMPSFCYGINSKYAFRLKKSKTGKDWVIQNVLDVTPDFDETNLVDKMAGFIGTDSAKGFRALVDRIFDQSLIVGLRLIDNSVVEPWKIENLPGFRLHSISAEGPRQNILHVIFDYEVADAERKRVGVANCMLDFDLEAKCYPFKSHQVLKTDTEETVLDYSNVLTQTNENEYNIKSFSRLKKISNSKITRFEETQAEDVYSLNDPPESDFTLSAFGLPEPPGVEWKKPFPWYLVLAGVGTVCLGIFFFLRSRSRRTQRA